MSRVRQGGTGLFLVMVLLGAGSTAAAPADAAPIRASSAQSHDRAVDQKHARLAEKAHDRAAAKRDATADRRSSNSAGSAGVPPTVGKGGVPPAAKPPAATPVAASSIGTPMVVASLPAAAPGPAAVTTPVRPIGPSAVGTRPVRSVAPSAQVRPSTPRSSVSRPGRPLAAVSAFLASLSPRFGAASLRATIRTSVPIAVAGFVLLLLVVMALFDKRDPKLARAPVHRDDGGMTFK